MMNSFFFRCSFLVALQFGLVSSLNAAVCSYNIVNEWPSGFTVSISITNDGNEAINGWSVDWQYSDGSTVNQLWDGNLSGSNPYTATNYGYNALIEPGETVSFGFNGVKSGSGQSAEIPEITGDVCGEPVISNEAPIAIANATTLSGIVPFQVTFDASTSSDPNGDNLSYLWDFGNGETSTSTAVTRTFSTAGEYSISLTVNDGQVNSLPDNLIVTAVEDTGGNTLYSLNTSLSSLYFVSTKNVHNVETHAFGNLSGEIKDNGAANLVVDLSSVDTGIETRDQRMRDFLFDVDNFPNASVSVGVNLDLINSLVVGSSTVTDISAILDLHGVAFAMDTTVDITKLSNSKILVRNTIPIVVNTSNHELNDGVEVLRNLAGLSVISYAVPVNFTLVFNLL